MRQLQAPDSLLHCNVDKFPHCHVRCLHISQPFWHQLAPMCYVPPHGVLGHPHCLPPVLPTAHTTHPMLLIAHTAYHLHLLPPPSLHRSLPAPLPAYSFCRMYHTNPAASTSGPFHTRGAHLLPPTLCACTQPSVHYLPLLLPASRTPCRHRLRLPTIHCTYPLLPTPCAHTPPHLLPPPLDRVCPCLLLPARPPRTHACSYLLC